MLWSRYTCCRRQNQTLLLWRTCQLFCSSSHSLAGELRRSQIGVSHCHLVRGRVPVWGLRTSIISPPPRKGGMSSNTSSLQVLALNHHW